MVVSLQAGRREGHILRLWLVEERPMLPPGGISAQDPNINVAYQGY